MTLASPGPLFSESPQHVLNGGFMPLLSAQDDATGQVLQRPERAEPADLSDRPRPQPDFGLAVRCRSEDGVLPLFSSAQESVGLFTPALHVSNRADSAFALAWPSALG